MKNLLKFKLTKTLSSVFKKNKVSTSIKLVFGTLISGITINHLEKKELKLEESLVEKVLCDFEDLQDGQMKKFQIGPDEKNDLILLARVDNQYYAVGSKCSHFSAPLDKGILFEDRVYCPYHLASFSVKTGYHDFGPVFKGLPVFKVLNKNGKISVMVPKSIKQQKKNVPVEKKNLFVNDTYVIIGGGPSAISAAESLRQCGFGGKIIMLGKEKYLTYDRTMLSKLVMKMNPVKMGVRNQEFLNQQEIDFRTNSEVVNVDETKKVVTLKNGGKVNYDKLLLASGTRARKLDVPGVGLNGIFTIREAQDLENLRNFTNGKNIKNIVVIGGSFIGTEVAGSLKTSFKESNVTLLNRSDVVFKKSFGNEVGEKMARFITKNGVKILNNTNMVEFKGNQNVEKVKLTDGREIEADLVVYGIGEVCNTDYLSDNFKDLRDKSILLDENLRSTLDQNVFAVGDIAKFPVPKLGLQRVSHYSEAITQGSHIAYNMLNKNIPYSTVPFFWTRFFNQSWAFTGFNTEFDNVIFNGKNDDKTFLAVYCKEKECFGGSGVGRNHDLIILNQAMRIGIPIMREQVSDDNYFKWLKKEVFKNKESCGCTKKVNIDK